MRRIFAFLLPLFLFPLVLSAQNPSALLAKAESAAGQQSAYSRIKMKAERPRYTREMELRSWNMGNAYSLVQIVAPERDAGMVYMKADKDLMTYSPRTGKVMKLPSSMLMQGWMGTDAQFDNILGAASLSTDFTHSYQGKKTVNGIECHVIRCVPKPSTPVAHDHVDAYIGVQNESWVRLVFFDKKGEISQQMDALHFQRFDGVLMPDQIRFTAKGGSQTTTLTVLEWRKRPDLKASWFTETTMKKIDSL